MSSKFSSNSVLKKWGHGQNNIWGHYHEDHPYPLTHENKHTEYNNSIRSHVNFTEILYCLSALNPFMTCKHNEVLMCYTMKCWLNMYLNKVHIVDIMLAVPYANMSSIFSRTYEVNVSRLMESLEDFNTICMYDLL